MFGGLITFSAHTDNGVTVAQVQPLIRASDPFYEVTLRLGSGSRSKTASGAGRSTTWPLALAHRATPQQTSVIRWRCAVVKGWAISGIMQPSGRTFYHAGALLRRLRR